MNRAVIAGLPALEAIAAALGIKHPVSRIIIDASIDRAVTVYTSGPAYVSGEGDALMRALSDVEYELREGDDG